MNDHEKNVLQAGILPALGLVEIVEAHESLRDCSGEWAALVRTPGGQIGWVFGYVEGCWTCGYDRHAYTWQDSVYSQDEAVDHLEALVERVSSYREVTGELEQLAFVRSHDYRPAVECEVSFAPRRQKLVGIVVREPWGRHDALDGRGRRIHKRATARRLRHDSRTAIAKGFDLPAVVCY